MQPQPQPQSTMPDVLNPDSFHNYLRVSILLNDHGLKCLRQIFLSRFQKITNRNWEDGTPFAEGFLKSLCEGSIKSLLPTQKEMIEAPELKKLDLMILASLIQCMDLEDASSDEKKNILRQNDFVTELNNIRNRFINLPGKSVEDKEFNELWEQITVLLTSLGVSADDIEEVKNVSNLDDVELKTKQNVDEKACNDIEELESIFPGLSTSGKPVASIESQINSELPPEIVKLIEACCRMKQTPSMAKHAALNDSPLNKYWTHLEEISKRAKDEYPFANTMLKAMGYFSEGLSNLKNLYSKNMNPSDVENVRNLLLFNLANSFRASEIVAFFQPSDLPDLANICKAKLTKEKSDLDLATRVVYSYVMSCTQNSELLSFLKINCQKYPKEVFFYKIYSGALAVKQNYKAAMKVADDGLKHCPKNSCLLCCKAGALKMIDSPAKKIIAAYEEFIKEAPFDERTIPEAYYNIAFCYLGKDTRSEKEATRYYSKGLEEEKKLLSCFIPYDSNVKNLLEALLTLDSKEGYSNLNKNMVEKVPAAGMEKFSMQIKNPIRLQIVLRHRETLNSMAEIYSDGLSKESTIVNTTVTPENDQQMPKDLANIEEITFRDMHPRKDQVYQNRIINLLITEDPMFGLFPAIHVIVRDDNGDCLNCSFYQLDDADKNVRAKLCFGSKIGVVNPYYRISADGTIALRVDDPKSIFYYWSGKEKHVCRFCWNENSPHACGRCKRARYCSRDCQTEDWKVLKHKLICGLTYLNDM